MDRSYALVSRAKWGEVSLRDIVTEELSGAQSKSAARVTIDGIAVGFEPQAALALSLVMHELASNAQKHGALSTPKGRLNIQWALSNPHGKLLLTWDEKAGKKVKHPTSKGFGLELVERELKSALGAAADFTYGPQGLSVKISIPTEPRRWSVLTELSAKS
jgi:two-component sensor histidine kinase